MITVLIRANDVESNAGFVHHSLLVKLQLTNRNDLWHPTTIYAVLTEAFRFHVEQVKKMAVKHKERALIFRLELQRQTKTQYALCVPADEVWPFSDFASIAYNEIHDAARIACGVSQEPDASVQPLWVKP